MAQNGEYVLLIFVLIFALIFAFILALISWKRNIKNRKLLESVTSFDRGTKSERDLVLNLLKSGIPQQTIFHDLCLEMNNGKYSQIDVVLATKEGIIVFEVKDYSGWIFGNGKHTHWTKVLAYGKQKYRFYNPIMQNKSHIAALKKQLPQFGHIPFFSIIVFYGECELKEINYIPEGTYIVKPYRIRELLNKIKAENLPAPYTNKMEIVRVLKQAVHNATIISKQKQHVDNIKDLLGKDRILD